MRKDDLKAMGILKNSTEDVTNRYEVGLMWRDPNMKLPDNMGLTLRYFNGKNISENDCFAVIEDLVVGNFYVISMNVSSTNH